MKGREMKFPSEPGSQGEEGSEKKEEEKKEDDSKKSENRAKSKKKRGPRKRKNDEESEEEKKEGEEEEKDERYKVLTGKECFEKDINDFFNVIKEKEEILNEFKIDFENASSKANEKGLWGSKSHFVFVRTGCYDLKVRDFVIDLKLLDKASKASNIEYYRFINYKLKTTKKNDNRFITYLHIHYNPGGKLSAKLFNDWYLVKIDNIKDIEPRMIGNIGTGKIGKALKPYLRIPPNTVLKIKPADFIDKMNKKISAGRFNNPCNYEIIDDLPNLD